MTQTAIIRDALAADHDAILRLNARWEHVTSPIDAAALASLHHQSVYHRVVDVDGRVAAFLLALGPGATYDSPNYRFFNSARERFIYIDRVVVSEDFHRAGFAGALYEDLAAFARSSGAGLLACEVDVEPMNAASDAFHRRQGFVEVGTQWISGGTKRVSLRERALD